VISYECRVGRLIEIRLRSPFDLAQAHDIAGRAAQLFLSREGKFVSCVDMRGILVLSPDVADDMLVNLKRANRRIERTAVLLPTSPTVALQVERLHREAGNPARRTYREQNLLEQFLGEALDETERRALKVFLNAT
jgi:hypothetical protein